MAAKNPTVLYNFNENSTTDIKDYSQSGYNGVGANLTVSASTRVGYDAVFNGSTSELTADNVENIVDDKLGYFFAINLTSNTGTDYVFNHNGVCYTTWDGTTLSVTLTTSVTTYTLTNDITALSTGTWYDITITKGLSNLNLVIDGVAQTAAAVSGTITKTATTLYIGHNASANHSAIKLNEFKVFEENITLSNDSAFRNEQNGVLMNTALTHDFNIGDIIAADIVQGSIKGGIVTYVEASTIFRIQPISDNITGGMIFNRVGHLWDTDRQWRFVINDTPEICFYDGISRTGEVFSESKKTYCIGKDGVAPVAGGSTTVTTTYQVLSTDQRIYVDSSGGAFTITLEASPATNRELEIIDSVGSCNSNTVTVAGNGNNIIGNSNYSINGSYDALRLVFNGANWNLN